MAGWLAALGGQLRSPLDSSLAGRRCERIAGRDNSDQAAVLDDR